MARDGRSWGRPGLVLQVLSRGDRDAVSPAADAIRVGFTTSRKVGNAVARNRARRRLREVARMVLPTDAAFGRDYVLIGRPATIVRPFSELVADLRAALRRLGAERRPPVAGAAPAAAGEGSSPAAEPRS